VLDEVFTLLGRIAGNQSAYARAQSIYGSQIINTLRPDAAVEREALRDFLKCPNQGVSFADSTSIALMKKHGLKRAFTFDEHFRLAGFDLYGG
jgi:predicted nucleic acid-binding protein